MTAVALELSVVAAMAQRLGDAEAWRGLDGWTPRPGAKCWARSTRPGSRRGRRRRRRSWCRWPTTRPRDPRPAWPGAAHRHDGSGTADRGRAQRPHRRRPARRLARLLGATRALLAGWTPAVEVDGEDVPVSRETLQFRRGRLVGIDGGRVEWSDEYTLRRWPRQQGLAGGGPIG